MVHVDLETNVIPGSLPNTRKHLVPEESRSLTHRLPSNVLGVQSGFKALNHIGVAVLGGVHRANTRRLMRKGSGDLSNRCPNFSDGFQIVVWSPHPLPPIATYYLLSRSAMDCLFVIQRNTLRALGPKAVVEDVGHLHNSTLTKWELIIPSLVACWI